MIEDKFAKAILQLNRLTQENKIKWVASEPPPNFHKDPESLILAFFSTKHEGKILGIYKMRVTYKSKYNLDEIVELSIFSQDGKQEWIFPDTSGLYNLYDSVNYQAANVDSYIDSILRHEDSQSVN